MSWDVDLTIETGPNQWHVVEDFNHTDNQFQLIQDLFGEPYLWDCVDGMKAGVLAEILTAGLHKCETSEIDLAEYDSPNGWGTGESCYKFLWELRNACKKHRYTIVRVYK